jgi:hypothetical protein
MAIVNSYRAATWGRCRSSRRLSTMRPIRAYAATFEAINQYHLTPKWKAKLIGTIGHVNRARPHKTGCGDIGIAKLRITQTPATMKPTSAHNPILRFMVSGLIEPMLRLDDSPGQLVRQFGQLTQSGGYTQNPCSDHFECYGDISPTSVPFSRSRRKFWL